jgi:uncharacterized coiled-coil protein SlyX
MGAAKARKESGDFRKDSLMSIQAEHTDMLERLETTVTRQQILLETLNAQISTPAAFANLLRSHTDDSKQLDRLLAELIDASDKRMRTAILKKIGTGTLWFISIVVTALVSIVASRWLTPH